MATRLKNINESYRVTGEIIAERSREEWLQILGGTKVPMMVVNSLDDLVDDPHLVGTGFWQEFEHPSEGRLRMSSPPMNFSRTPASIRSLQPRLGQNTREVLSEAGLEDKLIDSMIASGEAVLPTDN